MNETTPLISVIMPVYNGADFLPEAVQSIYQQKYRPLELIIVDDGSTDSTPGVVQSLQANSTIDIRYLQQANAGPAAARNTGIQMARGTLIAFLDVDDLYPLDKLGRQWRRLQDDPALLFVTGRIKYELLPGSRPNEGPVDDSENMVIFVHLGGALFHREAFDIVGLFDASLRYSEDVDWYFRAMESGVGFVIMKEAGLIYRRHGTNMTRLAGDRRMAMSFLNVVKRSMMRRRQPDGSIKRLPEWVSYFDTDLRPDENPFNE